MRTAARYAFRFSDPECPRARESVGCVESNIENTTITPHHTVPNCVCACVCLCLRLMSLDLVFFYCFSALAVFFFFMVARRCLHVGFVFGDLDVFCCSLVCSLSMSQSVSQSVTLSHSPHCKRATRHTTRPHEMRARLIRRQPHHRSAVSNTGLTSSVRRMRSVDSNQLCVRCRALQHTCKHIMHTEVSIDRGAGAQSERTLRATVI